MCRLCEGSKGDWAISGQQGSTRGYGYMERHYNVSMCERVRLRDCGAVEREGERKGGGGYGIREGYGEIRRGYMIYFQTQATMNPLG